MADGFLGRWARRKHEALQGTPLDEAVKPSPQPSPASGRGGETGISSRPGVSATQSQGAVSHPVPPAGEGQGEDGGTRPLPTLQDVQMLTPQSDYTVFMTQGVTPEVKNAAMKKLFTDPHFNVMDRLDTYIDDYGIPDPLPLSMLRQMASAQFLNLFDDEDKDKKPPGSAPVRDNASLPAAPPAVDAAPAAQDPPTMDHHADTDLRLQQDHAAGARGSGHGA